MIQALLFFFFLVPMGFLISSVIESSISGVVILIFGVPITVAFILLTLITNLGSMTYSNVGNSEEELVITSEAIEAGIDPFTPLKNLLEGEYLL